MMERFRYDRSSKWLIDHHGDQILRLGGVEDVTAWTALAAEVVQPRQLPDGLLEVERRGRPKRELFLVEIETYADRAIDEQVMDDVMLVYQARRVVPEVLLLVLRPKGQVQVLGASEVASPSGRTRMWGRWPVVELWKLPADAMLALREPGLVPWIPLMKTAKPPDQLLKECREIIDEGAAPEELDNILAVAQILASLRYNEQRLFDFFGGKKAMIMTPYLKEIVDEQVAEQTAKRVAKELPERVAQEVAEELPKRVAKEVAEELPKRVAKEVAEELPKRVAKEVAEELPKRVAKEVAEELPKRVAKEVAEELPKQVAKEVAKEVAKRMHRAIESTLKTRFAVVPAEMVASLDQITNDDQLDALVLWAGTCPDLDSFRQQLPN
jgi:ribosomal protein S17E